MRQMFGKYGHVVDVLLGASLLLALFLISLPAAAQNAAKAPEVKKGPCIGCSVDGKTTPMVNGHPDFNGFWNNLQISSTEKFERSADGSILFDFSTAFNDGKGCLDDACQDPNQPSYKPEYMKKVRELGAKAYDGTNPLDPQYDCKPLGVPRSGINSVQIVQTADVIAVLYEGAPNSTWRLIYTDGRPHPDDLDTSFNGDSIGHWEGNTLVVDVVGLTDESWLAGGVGQSRVKYTTIHSDKMHVTERWTRDGDTLTLLTTVDDPVMFTKPWVMNPRRVKHAGPTVSSSDAILENVCAPNDKGHLIEPTAADPGACSYRCK
jgi:hypothetical protein